ncbi:MULTISPECIES: ArsR/SmtB family transcription factor [Paenibacillus]|jgi:rhodanese-related sulfurtransferase|uniref:ArsR/SmtB family transcription factor n=1 Tax=Paenibacillus TaxID=44249 RepID=UPI0003D2A104|nr:MULTISPECIES: metalloregulator ArsR/SmtB family transcription factor [Paenibacillus]AIW40073.1 ArsR family transcriptional regulator [Paenibacillus polymyxa CR1]MCP3794753.1 metalloregulator ArsR/SmtB family transcription factor [Paenibacillus sp. CH40]MCP3805617.1 metalloregulator ArsR/SmtB family transcription factor [Paenibacillus sp. Lou8.1]MDY7994149.1 metalloregulator ArsR/SmtB family transcription factor [Paenibacillus polymyxa]MDY8049109.1 metalloregulator ArsR/SmtB family transcrip
MEDMLNSAKIFKEDLYKQLARIGKCLSSDKRLEILNVLSNGSRTVEKIATCTDMNIANVSRHLQVLLDAKLVKFTKKGVYVIYSLADPEIIEFLSSLWRISEKQLPDISRMKDDFLNNLDDVQTLTMDEVREKINNDSIILVDLRPKEEYDMDHIAGAISVPMEELDALIREIPKNTEIIAYCRGPLCVYSALATQKLQSEGFTAFRMEEGLNEWQEHFQLH